MTRSTSVQFASTRAGDLSRTFVETSGVSLGSEEGGLSYRWPPRTLPMPHCCLHRYWIQTHPDVGYLHTCPPLITPGVLARFEGETGYETLGEFVGNNSSGRLLYTWIMYKYLVLSCFRSNVLRERRSGNPTLIIDATWIPIHTSLINAVAVPWRFESGAERITRSRRTVNPGGSGAELCSIFKLKL